MADTVYDLRANTQLTHHSLRIGAAGIGPRDYVDEAGISRHGLTAGLWIFYREDEAQDRRLWAYPGQALTVAGYHIQVVAIDPTAPGHVQLRLSEPPVQPL